MMQQHVRYRKNSILWYVGKTWHRVGDWPARYYFENKKLKYIFYCKHDDYHRTTGPAYIDCELKFKRYIYQGKSYASLEDMLMVEACK